MKYPGSKNRHGKQILSAILASVSCVTRWTEPFFGGGGMAQHTPASWMRRGYEINPFIVDMFNYAIGGGNFPDAITEDDYLAAKKDSANHGRLSFERSAHVGFIGVGCSFAGKWFGGYARGAGRNYCLESKRNIEKQAKSLIGFDLRRGSYISTDVARGEVIYCDPPYRGTTGYGGTFDSDAFFQVAKEWSIFGAHVFVSEYSAPDGWVSVWEKPVNSSLDKNTGGKKAVEKLFIYRGTES